MITREEGEAIRDSGIAVYIAATGAGAGLQKAIWEIPGISRVLIGASFPYAREEFDDFVGFKGEGSYASEGAAVDLAAAAYVRAKSVGGPARVAAGIGIAASVASLEERRGDHRIHAAFVSDKGCRMISLPLDKGTGWVVRDRDGYAADVLGSFLLLEVTGKSQAATEDATALLELRFWRHPFFRADGTRAAAPSTRGEVLYPGTFNPLHDGHRAVGRNAFAYVINVDNPHKGGVGMPVEWLARAAMFRAERRGAGGLDLLFTQGQGLFLDKVRRNPGAQFLVGADTFARMMDPAWGIHPETLFKVAKDQDVKFLVIPRTTNGKTSTRNTVLMSQVGSLSLAAYGVSHHVDIAVPEISSTAIRAQEAAKSGRTCPVCGAALYGTWCERCPKAAATPPG